MENLPQSAFVLLITSVTAVGRLVQPETRAHGEIITKLIAKVAHGAASGAAPVIAQTASAAVPASGAVVVNTVPVKFVADPLKNAGLPQNIRHAYAEPGRDLPDGRLLSHQMLNFPALIHSQMPVLFHAAVSP
jgi:hypothetical protein